MEGGLRKKKIKRVGALRAGWRVDCEKMCEVKRVCEKCKIKGVGALRGRWREDGEKNVQN